MRPLSLSSFVGFAWVRHGGDRPIQVSKTGVSVDGTAKPSVDSGRLVALVEHLWRRRAHGTADRQVAHINQAFATCFLVGATGGVLGGDCVEAARSLGPLLGTSSRSWHVSDELIDAWATVVGERIPLTDGRLLERDFLPVTHPDPGPVRSPGSTAMSRSGRTSMWRPPTRRSSTPTCCRRSAMTSGPRDRDRGTGGTVAHPADRRTNAADGGQRAPVGGESRATMLDDFMDAARADAGRLDIRAEEANPESLLESVTDMVAPNRPEPGVAAAIGGLPPRCPPRSGSTSARVRQVLLNLVSNAVKFASASHVLPSRATVRRDSGGDRLGGRVWGHRPRPRGPVAGQSLHCFVQGPQEGRRTATGAGLGLSIASRLAAAMGGAVWLSPRRGHRVHLPVQSFRWWPCPRRSPTRSSTWSG